MTEVKLAHLVKCSNVKATGGLAPYVALEHVESGTGQLLFGVEIEEREADGVLFEPGDVLFGKLRPYLHKVLNPDFSGVCSSELLVLRPGRGLESRYLYYLALTRRLADWASASSYGVKMPRTSWELLRQLPVGVPGLAEQRAIAVYLDAETARIDALIAKKRRMIELLEERWRAALDDALASVPEGVPFGRFVTSIGQGVSPPADDRMAAPGELKLLKLSAVKKGQYVPSEHKALDSTVLGDYVRYVPRIGDVLVTRSNTPQLVGDVCTVRHEDPSVVLCDLIYRLTVSKSLSSEFATLALMGGRARAHFASTARGTSQSMVKLRGEDIKRTPIPLLSLADQLNMARVLSVFRHETMAMIGAVGNQMELLAERRQALITATVTGELPVPGVAA